MQKIIFVPAIASTFVALLVGCAAPPPPPTKPPVVQVQKAQDSISLVQSKRGAAIAVSDKLLFDVGKTDLKSDAGVALDQIATILKAPKYAFTKVLIEGHTDNQGSKALNEKLSDARANVVVQSLLDRNVQPNRLAAKGYGFSEPVAANDTEASRQKNRRVEVVFPQETVESLKAGTQDTVDFNVEVDNVLQGAKGSSK